MIAAILVLAFVLFTAAAVLYYRGRVMSDAILATGLAAFMVAAVMFTLEEPPIPPTPIPENDFGGYRPHYQGHGTMTTGGRGGEIRRVSNASELITAVQARAGCADTPQSCARIVIFDSSGNYSTGGQITIDSPYLTIAGQTAPDDGVTLLDTRFLIDTHDVVVQHIKIRRPPRSLNACSVGDAGDGGDNSHVYNVVFDHVTCTWSNEVNNLLVAGPGSHDVAILDSFVAEGLWPGGLGGIGAGIGYKNTVARNLFTQHWSRQPIWGAPAELALYNNVSYNGTDNSHGYDTLPAFFGDADGEGSGGAKSEAVIINNLVLVGPDSGQAAAMLGLSKKQASIDAGSKIYMEGNYGPVPNATQWQQTICLGSYGSYSNQATCGDNSNMRTNTLFGWFAGYKFVVMPTEQVLDKVLANAGARPKNRDSADNRMIADVRNRTGTHYLDISGVQLPQLEVNFRACQIPTDPNVVADEAGRTRMDQFLETDAACGAQRLEVR